MIVSMRYKCGAVLHVLRVIAGSPNWLHVRVGCCHSASADGPFPRRCSGSREYEATVVAATRRV